MILLVKSTVFTHVIVDFLKKVFKNKSLISLFKQFVC